MENTNLTASEKQIKPIGLTNNILVQNLDKEVLLYDLERDKAYCLNETSGMIWNLCDGENTVEDIRRRVGLQLKTRVPEEVIWLALDDLKNKKLLGDCEEIKSDFNGLSRRAVIRKMGLATMIALPLILAVTSPTVAQVQSLVCLNTTACFCADAVCVGINSPVLLMNPCETLTCSNSGGANCWCVGPFICAVTPGQRLGRCGLV